MRKIVVYIAMSMNGYIADEKGGVEWLDLIPNPDKSDFGYKEFYDSIDTTIMGYSTFKQIVDWGIEFPYKNKKNYVVTKKQDVEKTAYVEFVNSNHIEFFKELKQKQGKDIWLIGGGQVNTMMLNEELIDEMIVFGMPFLLSNGIKVFEGKPKNQLMELKESKEYSNGVVKLVYSISVGSQATL